MKLVHPAATAVGQHAPGERYVLQEMCGAGLAWLPVDLLTPEEG